MRFTVKLGGSILEDPATREVILRQVAELSLQGEEIILVHGGGKSLSRRLAELGISSNFVSGLRVTDSATLAVALMVLSGEVNKSLVAQVGRLGARAVGVCGADGSSVICEPVSGLQGYPEGLGFVGLPTSLRRDFFELLLGARLVPVVSSLAVGPDSQFYNINADQMAAICAWGTGCEALIYLTDVDGVRDEDGAVLGRLGRADIEGLRSRGIIKGGMLPKTSSCLEALDRGVSSVYIVPGARPGILNRFVKQTLAEGTHIHGN